MIKNIVMFVILATGTFFNVTAAFSGKVCRNGAKVFAGVAGISASTYYYEDQKNKSIIEREKLQVKKQEQVHARQQLIQDEKNRKIQ